MSGAMDEDLERLTAALLERIYARLPYAKIGDGCPASNGLCYEEDGWLVDVEYTLEGTWDGSGPYPGFSHIRVSAKVGEASWGDDYTVFRRLTRSEKRRLEREIEEFVSENME